MMASIDQDGYIKNLFKISLISIVQLPNYHSTNILSLMKKINNKVFSPSKVSVTPRSKSKTISSYQQLPGFENSSYRGYGQPEATARNRLRSDRNSLMYRSTDTFFRQSKNTEDNNILILEKQQKTNKEKQMQKFVDEVVSDPAMLYRLIDFKMLAAHYARTIQNQQQRISQLKAELSQQHTIYFQIYGKYHPSYQNKEKSKKQNNKEITGVPQYQTIIQEMKSIDAQLHKTHQQQKAILSMANQKQEIIEQSIYSLKQQLKESRKSFMIANAKQNNRLGQMVKMIASNKQKLKAIEQKFQRQKQRQQHLAEIRQRISQKKKRLEFNMKEKDGFKKRQTEQLKKYKQSMMHKNNSEKALKKTSQRKLSDLMKELLKIIKNGELTKLQALAKSHNVPLSQIDKSLAVRRKNSTTDTVHSEINEEEGNKIQKNQMEVKINKLEEQNPALKLSTHQISGVKSIEESDIYRGIMSSSWDKFQIEGKEFETEVKDKDEKIESLRREEAELDSFIEELQKRTNQKQRQIEESEKYKHLLKKTVSSIVP